MLASFTAADAIPTISVGTAGQRMPLVSLGTGSGQHGDVENATAMWLQVGGSGIDTAYIYRDEDPIAAGVKAVGASWGAIFLTTKIPCATTQESRANVASNLRSLSVGSVDLLLIHEPHAWSGGRCSVAETWAVLEEAQAAGQAKSIGVSNFKISDLQMLAATAKVAPAVNQCSHSVSYHDDATAAYCARRGIVYEAYSPLCGGANGSSCSHGSVLAIPLVQRVARAHAVSSAQVALKWVVQQGWPLTTAVWRRDFMLADLDLWSWGNLTSREMGELSAYAAPAPASAAEAR